MIESLGKVKYDAYLDKRPVQPVRAIPDTLNRPSFTSNISYNGQPVAFKNPRDMHNDWVKNIKNTAAAVQIAEQRGRGAVGNALDTYA